MRQQIALKAVVLVGGTGTRLFPVTTYVPKALIPIGRKLVIDHILDFLAQFRIREVLILASSENNEVIRHYLGDGSDRNLIISYDIRDRIGTAGAIGAVGSNLPETFIIYYGDVLVDFELDAMIRFHKKRRAVLTIALSKSVPIDYGVARLSADGRVVYFKEKPTLPEYPVSMGILVAEPEILPYCREHTDLSNDVIPRLLEDKIPVWGFLTERRHYDVGTFRTLEEARNVFGRETKDAPPNELARTR